MAAINVKTLFRQYLKHLSEVALRGDAREESFYPAGQRVHINVTQ